jgi:hypothetical protein
MKLSSHAKCDCFATILRLFLQMQFFTAVQSGTYNFPPLT